MVEAKYLLVVLEICVLFQAAYSAWICNTSVHGQITDFPVQIHSALLPAGIRGFNVEIPNVCNQVGVREEVCDYDSAPKVYIMSSVFASVQRTGFLFRDGIVTAKVYCPEPWSDSNIYYGGAAPSLKVKESHESPSKTPSVQHSSTGRSSNALLTNLGLSRLESGHGLYRPPHDAQAIDARQAANIVRQSISANARQDALEQTRNHALNEALHNAQAVDGHQGAGLVRNAMTANAYQVAQGTHGMRLADQTTNAHRNILRESSQRRIRRALQSSDSRQEADMVREAKADQTRHAVLEQAQQQAAHEARRGYPNLHAQRKNQQLITQNLSPHALLPLKYRQAADGFQKALGPNARHATLEQTRNQALNEAVRSAQIADGRQGADIVREAKVTKARQAALENAHNQALNKGLPYAQSVDGREGADVMRETIATNARQATLDQTRSQALNKALYTAQTVDGHQGAEIVRNSIEDNARLAAYGQYPYRKRHRIYRSVQETQAASTHQSADKAHEAKEANERQAALDQTRQHETHEARLTDPTSNTRRNILREPTQRHVRRASKSSDTSQMADVVREAKADKARQAIRDQRDQRVQQKVTHDARYADLISESQRKNHLLTTQKRSRRALLSFDHRQATDDFQVALAANARQAAMGQAHNQAFNEAFHNPQIVDGRQANEVSQSTDAHRAANAVHESIVANARQAAALDQARYHALQQTGYTPALTQSIDGRQGAAIVREATNARHAALEEARKHALNEAFGTAQTVDTRQATDVVREALAANARQAAALDQARRQALQLTGHTSEVSQSVDARQAADVLREAIAANAHQSTGLDQVHHQALQQTGFTSKVGHARQAADVVRQVLAANARQAAALDQARRQALLLTGRTSEEGKAIDARQGADMHREAIATNARQAALHQAQEAQRYPHMNQGVNNHLIADARQGLFDEQAFGNF